MPRLLIGSSRSSRHDRDRAVTPAAYVDVVVLPTVREFLQSPNDRRLAYLSAIATYHVVDYLMRAAVPPDAKRNVRDAEIKRIEQEIEARCGGDFHVVEGMCHGTKHCGRDGGRGKQFKPDDMKRSLAFGLGPGFGTFGESHFGSTRLLVFHAPNVHVVDWAIRDFLLAAVDAFPKHLGSVDLVGIRS